MFLVEADAHLGRMNFDANKCVVEREVLIFCSFFVLIFLVHFYLWKLGAVGCFQNF